jgi:hypothetical protein
MCSSLTVVYPFSMPVAPSPWDVSTGQATCLGLADTPLAVVRKGDVVRPVALRLDASGGRWKVTELRWWRNETDTAATSG